MSEYRSERMAHCAMKYRCVNPKSPDYHNYGGRGIKVCRRWSKSFPAFLADMGPRPSPVHSLDRIDNNGNYEPGNVRWATWATQRRNSRQNVFFTLNGLTKCVSDLAADAGLHRMLVYKRLWRGWSIERALSAPRKYGRK